MPHPTRFLLLTIAVAVAVHAQAGVADPPADPSAPGQERINSKDGTVLVWVPAGAFEMGTPAKPDGLPRVFGGPGLIDFGEPDERPVRKVTMSGFWLAKFEVSNAQFIKFIGETKFKTDAETAGWGWQLNPDKTWGAAAGANWRTAWADDIGLAGRMGCPVANVSWNDAVAYCRWAGLTLPSEAQWEYAARGPRSLKFPFGNTYDLEKTVSLDRHPATHLAPVDSVPANVSWCGAQQLAGNVAEWCLDWYRHDQYANALRQSSGQAGDRDPLGPETGTAHVVRGGSWQKDFAGGCRSAMRNSSSGWWGDIGFRPAAVAGAAVPKPATSSTVPRLVPVDRGRRQVHGSPQALLRNSILPSGAVRMDGGYPFTTLWIDDVEAVAGKIIRLAWNGRSPRERTAIAFHWTIIGDDGKQAYLSGSNHKMYMAGEPIRRYASTRIVPDVQARALGLHMWTFGRGGEFSDISITVVGDEPADELVDRDDDALVSMLDGGGFEGVGLGPASPVGWNLEAGGQHVIAAARTGERALKLLPESRVSTPSWRVRLGNVYRVSFWARGHGHFAVQTAEISNADSRLPFGDNGIVYDPILGRHSGTRVEHSQTCSLTEEWRKYEFQLHVSAYNRNAPKMRLEFATAAQSELTVDDIQVKSDTTLYPPPERPRNRFTGAFTSPNAKLTVTLAGKPIADMADGIEGSSVLVIKAEPRGEGAVKIDGYLEFAEGGSVGIDRHWLWTLQDPGPTVDEITFSDASWHPGSSQSSYIEPNQPTGGPVWFRRVIAWRAPQYLFPMLTALPIAKGFGECVKIALTPTAPAAVTRFELIVDMPAALTLMDPGVSGGAYMRQHETWQQVGDHEHRRYRLTWPASEITGAARGDGTPGSRSAMLFFKQTGDLPADGGVVSITRIMNRNIVDFPVRLPIVQEPPLDGTAPKEIMLYQWPVPYFTGNPPAPTFSYELSAELVNLWLNSGATVGGWPFTSSRYDGKFDDYAERNMAEGGAWISRMRELDRGVMPVWHRFPQIVDVRDNPIRNAYVETHGDIISGQTEAHGKLRSYGISFAWLLSDESDAYWQLWLDEHRQLRDNIRGLELDIVGITWDHEFEIDSYAGGGYHPATLELFRERGGIAADVALDRDVIAKRFKPAYHEFSRWACRQLIAKASKQLDSIGLKFHIYFGEGRPFDKGNCHIISAYMLSQNVSGQVPSVKQEYDLLLPGRQKDPSIRHIGILQPKIQSAHRNRPFYYLELRNNIVKRAVATGGGGSCIWWGTSPYVPTTYYGHARAARFLAQWEDYFINFEPVFAGAELDGIVTLSEQPADIVLLKKGARGLLLLFGGEPEAQTEAQHFDITLPDGTSRKIHLPSLGLQAIELAL